MKLLKSIFFGGLKFIIPFSVTLILIYWFFTGLERFFSNILLIFMDSSSYFEGLGWIVAIVFTLLIGLLIQIPILKEAIESVKAQFLKLPIIKTLYGMSSDVMMFLTKSGIQKGKVVSLETDYGKILGIMTQDELGKLPGDLGDEDVVAVYIPMSYQIGGFTFLVPKKSVEVLDISVQQGITLTMTAYISGKK